MWFLAKFGLTSTTVWLRPLDSKETLGKTAWLEVHMKASSCNPQIIEAAPHKIAAERNLAFHLTNSLSNK